MPKKYAIEITEETLALVRVLSHFEQPVTVKEYKTYFLFTVDSPNSTTDHDVYDAESFEADDSVNKDRIILK